MAQFIGFGNSNSGSPNAISGVINTYAACTGTSGAATVTTALSVSVGDMILLHQSKGTGVGQWELVFVKTVGSGEFTADRNLTYTYASGAQAVKVPQYTGGTIGSTISCTGWGGTTGGIIALASSGSLIVNATISVAGGNPGSGITSAGTTTVSAAGGFRGGYGRRAESGVPYYGQPGESHNGFVADGSAANNTGGGGGGVVGEFDERAGGGGGSHATSGVIGTDSSTTVNSVPGAAATTTVGNAALTSAYFGGGGGGGALRRSNGSWTVYGGSNGGGFILIIAKEITMDTSGLLTARGGGGVSGPEAIGGAGAGGSILVKAQRATLGTNKLLATGGDTNTSTLNGQGGAGGNGRIHLDYLTYSGTTSPTIDVAQDLLLQDSAAFAMGQP